MTLAADIAALAGSPVVRLRPIGGGSVGSAYRVDLHDGASLFAKTGGGPAAAEAAGLAWLADGGADVPGVIGFHGDLLVLTWVDPLAPSPSAARGFGRRLARLHLSGAPAFGSAPPGVADGGSIGAAPMSYAACGQWPDFFAEHRIRPYLLAARESGHLTADQYGTVARVCDGIGRWAGPPVPPARLHGDLWSGNLIWAPRRPC